MWVEEQRRRLVQAQADGEIAEMPLDALILAANSLVMGLAQLIISGGLGDVGLILREPPAKKGRRPRAT